MGMQRQLVTLRLLRQPPLPDFIKLLWPWLQVAELGRLGARVVAADCSSLVLATGKRNLTAAVG